MYNTCRCCKELCNESKKHDFLNNNWERHKVSDLYKEKIKRPYFIADAQSLIGEICLECFLAQQKFEFEWFTAKQEAQIQHDLDYEAYRESDYNF